MFNNLKILVYRNMNVNKDQKNQKNKEEGDGVKKTNNVSYCCSF